VVPRNRPARTTTTPMAMITATMRRPSSSFQLLQVEDLVDTLAPREDEVEALTPEERTEDDKHRPEHHEDGEQSVSELTVLGLVARILVDVAGCAQSDQAETRDRHPGD